MNDRKKGKKKPKGGGYRLIPMLFAALLAVFVAPACQSSGGGGGAKPLPVPILSWNAATGQLEGSVEIVSDAKSSFFFTATASRPAGTETRPTKITFAAKASGLEGNPQLQAQINLIAFAVTQGIALYNTFAASQ